MMTSNNALRLMGGGSRVVSKQSRRYSKNVSPRRRMLVAASVVGSCCLVASQMTRQVLSFTPPPRMGTTHGVSNANSSSNKCTSRIVSSIHSVLPSSSSSVEGTGSLSSLGTVDDKPTLPPIPSTTKRLFLVRHGEVINPGGDRPVYYGAMDVPLSPLGEHEAKVAALYLQEFYADIDLVVSSPLSRAVYGADQVVHFLSSSNERRRRGGEEEEEEDVEKLMPVPKQTTIDGFRELDRGAWCGKTKDEIGDDMMARFDACDESVTPVGGESFTFLKDRVLKARDEVLNQLSPGRAAVIVSHLQVTRSILSDALGMPTNQMAGLKVATASVTCIDYDCDDNQSTVQFQSFKPNTGLAKSKDGAN